MQIEEVKSFMPNKKRKTTNTTKKFKSSLPATLRTLKPEIKTVDVINNGSPPNTFVLSSTPTISLLNGIAEGTGTFNRVGRRCHMKSLRFTGWIGFTALAGNGAGELIRLMIVYDRQPNGSLPAATDVLQSLDQAGNNSTSVYDGLNTANFERFRVLRDIKWSIPDTGVAGAAGPNQLQTIQASSTVDFFIKLKDLEVHFSGNGGTITNISTGTIFLLGIGSQAAASAAFRMNYVTRLRYIDV